MDAEDEAFNEIERQAKQLRDCRGSRGGGQQGSLRKAYGQAKLLGSNLELGAVGI